MNTEYKLMCKLKEKIVPTAIRIFYMDTLSELLANKKFKNIKIRKVTYSSLVASKNKSLYQVVLFGTLPKNSNKKITICPVLYKYNDKMETFIKMFTSEHFLSVFVKGENYWKPIQKLPKKEDIDFILSCYEALKTTQSKFKIKIKHLFTLS